MSLDQPLLDQMFHRDRAGLAALFEQHDEPAALMVLNECRRLVYANEVARWIFGFAPGLSLHDVHFEAVDGTLVGDMFAHAMGRCGAARSVTRTLPVVHDEEWTIAMTRIVFEGSPAAAVVIARRLRRGDRLTDRRGRCQTL